MYRGNQRILENVVHCITVSSVEDCGKCSAWRAHLHVILHLLAPPGLQQGADGGDLLQQLGLLPLRLPQLRLQGLRPACLLLQLRRRTGHARLQLCERAEPR